MRSVPRSTSPGATISAVAPPPSLPPEAGDGRVDDPTHPGIPIPVRWFVLGVVVTATLMLGVVVSTAPAAPVAWGTVAWVLVFATLSFTDVAHLFFGQERHRISFSFSEAAVVVALVFLPAVLVPFVISVANALYHAILRRGLLKSIFNAGQDSLGASVAVLLLFALPDLGARAEGASLVAAAVAAMGYVLTTALLNAVLLRLLMGSRPWSEIVGSFRIDLFATLGSISVAALSIHLWLADPVLLVFAAVPLVAIVLAYRATLASHALARQRSADAEGLRRLVASASDGIVLLDRAGVVRVWNPLMERLTGVASAEAEGSPLPTVMHGVERTADSPLAAEPSVVATWRGGRVMEEYSSEVSDTAGRDAGKVIVLRDITRQQEVEALKSDFVARVSHELRTPLTPIAGFIELLRRDRDRFDAAMHETVLSAMARNTDRMAALVDELLLVAELDRGGIRQRTAAIDVARVAEAARDRVGIETTAHRIHLDIPPGTVAGGEEERLVEVLRHLIDNAVRYSPAGTAVVVTAHADDDEVAIRVRDEGPGIPDSAQEVIFERFSRLEGPLRMRTSGLGLGLFVARRLTESMGGTLTIAASGHDGTTMQVRLPREPDGVR